jgi:hypothetical protein
MRIHRLLVLASIACALGSPAYAGPITLSDGVAGTIPKGARNDFIPELFGGPKIGGYFGSEILFSVPGLSNLVIDFFGAEAGYVNKFSYSGSTVFTHSGGTHLASSLGSPLATFSTTISSGSGLLPFNFKVNNNAKSVANGSNPIFFKPSFFASCDPFGGTSGSGGTNCSSAYLFLDDGGAGPDKDYDDFLVRLSVTPVPEPATIFLVGAGLLVALRPKSRA